MADRNNVVPLQPARIADPATLDGILRQIGNVDELTPLPSASVLAAALDDVNRSLTPGGHDMALKAVTMMLVGFPTYKPDPAYIVQLSLDLAGFPADAVSDGTAWIRRTLKFPPSHAEVIAAVEARVRPRHAGQRKIKAAQREQDRREGERRRREQDEREQAARCEEIDQHLGLEPGRYAAAERYMRWNRPMHVIARFTAASAWEAALVDREPWAIATLHAAALISEVFDAPLSMITRMTVLQLAESDTQDAARQELRRVASEGDPAAVILPPRADWSKVLPSPLAALLDRLIDRCQPKGAP
jgi:hypothetical protein